MGQSERYIIRKLRRTVEDRRASSVTGLSAICEISSLPYLIGPDGTHQERSSLLPSPHLGLGPESAVEPLVHSSLEGCLSSFFESVSLLKDGEAHLLK